jgi:hypothetical protein
MSGPHGVGRMQRNVPAQSDESKQAMVTTVAGPPLTKFTGLAQPQRAIPGPGSNALQMIPANDVTTWLVSPGVVDGAILTIVLDTTRQGGAIVGGHRPGGAQATARAFIRATARTSIPSVARARRRSRRCLLTRRGARAGWRAPVIGHCLVRVRRRAHVWAEPCFWIVGQRSFCRGDY